MLQQGDKVPADLEGQAVYVPDDTAHKTLALKELYKEKILVLFFYPKDMTSGCTTEARAFAAAFAEFEKLGVQVAGCSRDSTERHCKFMQKNSLPYMLISDSDGSMTEAFGVWQEKQMYGKSYMGIVRSTFIIKNGKIIKVFAKVKPSTHAEEVFKFLKNSL